MKSSYKYSALFVVLYYALFGVLWALITETLISLHPEWTAFEALDQIALITVSLFILYVLIRREIAEHERMEGEMNKLARVVQQTADHVVITNRDGIIEYVNPAFENVTGYSAKEALGKTPRILKSGRHEQSFYENLWRTILSGQVFTAEIINKKKDGSLYYEEKSITPIKDAQGRITNFVSTAKEITERKKAEEALIQADQMKTEFMSMVSHELRTPLTAIQGFVSLLDQETYGALTPVQKDFIAKIKTQSAHLYHLLTSVLDFTSLEYGGKFENNKEPVSLLTLVKEVLEGMRPDFDKKEIKLAINIPEDFPTIISDESKLERILTNLLGNAFKFTPRRGTVTIDARLDADSLTFTVRDTGIGIARENQSRIFDKFYQVDSSITRGYGGIGMGLALAQEIVQALGGRIGVESEGEGKGAAFIVTIPKK